jgi:hypothetical protein
MPLPSRIWKSDTRQACLVMIIIIIITTLNSSGTRNYCWSAGILRTRWSSEIRRSCCSDVVLIISFTVELQFAWSTSSTDNIDVVCLLLSDPSTDPSAGKSLRLVLCLFVYLFCRMCESSNVIATEAYIPRVL